MKKTLMLIVFVLALTIVGFTLAVFVDTTATEAKQPGGPKCLHSVKTATSGTYVVKPGCNLYVGSSAQDCFYY